MTPELDVPGSGTRAVSLVLLLVELGIHKAREGPKEGMEVETQAVKSKAEGTRLRLHPAYSKHGPRPVVATASLVNSVETQSLAPLQAS